MQVDLLGVMVWWNIQLNAVSLVNLVMVSAQLHIAASSSICFLLSYPSCAGHRIP